MEEIWVDIKGYENIYQISSYGNIKSLNRKVRCGYGKYRTEYGKIIKPQLNKTTGYYSVVLRNDNITRTFNVHRLVALHFVLNPFNLPQVNHKDENKLNNRADNLEWCAHRYNQNYGTHNLRMSNTKKGAKLTDTHKHKISEGLKKAYAEGRR